MTSRAVIFDFNRTLFDPTIYALYDGVKPMLQELSSRKQIFLYSRKSWNRGGLLRRLEIDDYFKGAYFVEQKTKENLGQILSEHGLEPRECVIVGDMIADELCVGSELGVTTVWFCPDIFDGVEAQGVQCVPEHTVKTIEELRDLLARL